MFSFVGDTVLDPFCGTGTTLIAALRAARNSVGIEIDDQYCRATARYLKVETANLNMFYRAHLSFETLRSDESGRLHVSENQALYNVRSAKTAMV
jgi:modification methylase